jgi:hypothetical protein
LKKCRSIQLLFGGDQAITQVKEARDRARKLLVPFHGAENKRMFLAECNSEVRKRKNPGKCRSF